MVNETELLESERERIDSRRGAEDDGEPDWDHCEDVMKAGITRCVSGLEE